MQRASHTKQNSPSRQLVKHQLIAKFAKNGTNDQSFHYGEPIFIPNCWQSMERENIFSTNISKYPLQSRILASEKQVSQITMRKQKTPSGSFVHKKVLYPGH